jgi:hypothetical protein
MADPSGRQSAGRGDPLAWGWRLDRRGVLRGLLLGGAGLTGLAACGVPSSSKPHVVRHGPTGAPSGANGTSAPAGPEGITDPRLFVRAFLQATAGGLDDNSRQDRVKKAREFLTPAAARAWQPDLKTAVTVVRVLNLGNPAVASGGSTITVELAQVGQLTTDGLVAPAPGAMPTAQLKLVPSEPGSGVGQHWHIDTLPPILASTVLLSSEGLDTYYRPHLVYFWDSKGPNGVLVPDLRYLSKSLTEEAQPTEIVNGVLHGPVDWLKSGVVALPANTTLRPTNVVRTDNAWEVNFVGLQGVDLNQVATQLQWSLRPQFSEPVRMLVEKQPKQVDTDALMKRNLANDRSRTSGPAGYFVVDGQVREVGFPYSVPAVFSKINDQTLTTASLSRDLRLGAVVRKDKNGHSRLSVGQRSDDEGGSPVFVDVSLPTGPMSRPVWLTSTPPRLLVAVGEVLYSVTLAGQATPLLINNGYSTQVSAFAVGPDGRRIALISGGQVYVSVLSSVADNPTVGAPKPIDSGGLTELSAVAWSRVDRLALAGKQPREGKYGLIEVSVDGAVANPLSTTLFDTRVTQLACNPPLAELLQRAGDVMVQTDGSGASRVSGDKADPLKYQPNVSPSPSSSSSTGPPPNPVVQNPFYVD